MNVLNRLRRWWLNRLETRPRHMQLGDAGERAARQLLTHSGLKFLTANYRSRHGEVDLIFRDADCLVFVEVKSRSLGQWTRPSTAVNAAKRRRLSLTAEAYLRELSSPRVKWRFDIVEVLAEGGHVIELRHLVNAFPHTTRRARQELR